MYIYIYIFHSIVVLIIIFKKYKINECIYMVLWVSYSSLIEKKIYIDLWEEDL